MVTDPLLLASSCAVIVAALMIVAETLHGRRIARVAHLAFGPSGRPRMWVALAPVVRVISSGCVAWGLIVLAMLPPRVIEKEPTQEASKHLLVCLDASPSMFVEDSGADGKTKRAIWAGKSFRPFSIGSIQKRRGHCVCSVYQVDSGHRGYVRYERSAQCAGRLAVVRGV